MFETISGLTNTGASILGDVEALSQCNLFWRSFTHWIGGMGVLVLIMAVLPLAGGYNMHLMRAESPGPTVGKLVPRVKNTARNLYKMYITLIICSGRKNICRRCTMKKCGIIWGLSWEQFF